MANMMISQYRQQVRAELRADANHGLEIAFLKWERGEAPEAVGGCDFTYVDVDPTVLEISAECTKGVTKTRLTRLFERTTPNL